ncbi:MAG: hypothetical protein V1821_03150 [bacterium]
MPGKRRTEEMARKFLRENFEQRLRVYREMPAFQCPEECQRPCCQNRSLWSEMTIFDILEIGKFLGMNPVEFFEKNVEFGIENVHDGQDNPVPFLWAKVLRLKRPCPLLGPDLKCRVQPVKPASCRVFPETHHLMGLNESTMPSSGFYNHVFGSTLVKTGHVCLKAGTSTKYLTSESIQRFHEALMINVHEFILSSLLIFGSWPSHLNVWQAIGEIQAIVKEQYEAQGLEKLKQTEIMRAEIAASGRTSIFISPQAVEEFARRRGEAYSFFEQARRVVKRAADSDLEVEFFRAISTVSRQIQGAIKEHGPNLQFRLDDAGVVRCTPLDFGAGVETIWA